MQALPSVFFASSNPNKFREAKNILSEFGISLKFFRCSLQEIQADSMEQIAIHKAKEAYSLCSKPVIVEDDGLFVSSLKGFPGPYSSFVFDTIGNKGILKLVSKQRGAAFRSIIAYSEKKKVVKTFDATLYGAISKKMSGTKWGFDPIFIPRGRSATFSQIKDKNMISHRYLALKKFASWYLHKRGSTGQ